MWFKDIYYLELWRPFRSTEWNHLAIVVEGILRKKFSEIILNFGLWVRRCLKDFLIWSSGSHPVQWSRTIYAIFVKDIMRNTSVKLFWIWTSGSGGDVIQRDFSSRALAVPFFSWSGTIYAILVEDIIKRNNSVKLFWICTRGSGGDVV